jgi:hypothetical protein
MNISFPQLALRNYQKSVWNHFHPDVPRQRGIIVWPRRNGKDLVSIDILASKAVQRRGLYLYTAPFGTQLRSIVWEGQTNDGKRFIDYIPSELVKRKLDQSMKVFLINGSIIHLIGGDDPDSKVGPNPVGVVFSEMSLQKPALYNLIRPILTANGGWALFNGTPRGMNHFFALTRMAKASPDWFYERLTAENTGYPSKEDIERDRQDGMPESLIQQEYYTSWTSSSENTLIPLDFVRIAMDTWLWPEDYNHAPRIIGVDPAYSAKGDRAVVIKRQGRKVFQPEIFRGIDPMELAGHVSREINRWHADYVTVDAGRGEAVWSRLRQLGHARKIVIVNFGGAISDPLYHRKRDQIWGRAKDYICDENHPPDLPANEELARELSSPTFALNDRNQVQVESAVSLKARGLPSLDIASALITTFAENFDEIADTNKALRRHLQTHGGSLSEANLQEIAEFLSTQANVSPTTYDLMNHLSRAYYEGAV